MRMEGAIGEDVPHDAFGKGAGTLVMLLYDGYRQARFDVISLLAVHGYTGSLSFFIDLLTKFLDFYFNQFHMELYFGF